MNDIEFLREMMKLTLLVKWQHLSMPGMILVARNRVPLDHFRRFPSDYR